MHDIKAIREDSSRYVVGWSARGVENAWSLVGEICELDRQLRITQTGLQEAQALRNDLSKQIGQAKGRKDEAEALRLMAEVERLKADIATWFEKQGQLGNDLKTKLATLPNLAAEDVPVGADEQDNVERHRWGNPKALPAGRLNQPKDHVDLGEAMGLMDFEAASRMSGARFVALRGELARLERAIGQFMLDLQTQENGYTEISPPLLVRDEAVFGTGQLPKFEQDLFQTEVVDLDELRNNILARANKLLEPALEKINLQLHAAALQGNLDEELSRAHELLNGENRKALEEAVNQAHREAAAGVYQVREWLIPTAEVPLTNLVREQITAEEDLPLRLTALTPCFRSEAGASGKDTRGMIRQHQFWKVELVSITTPEQSEAEHQRMTECAEAVLKRLQLPFRTMLLCTGDMGFSARKTYDLEVWLPSQDRYREISSCSNCGDFQARRMDARGRRSGEKGTRFVHTLNGSGLAVGRTLVAILENYQDGDGRIAIPDALQPYMPGQTHIGGGV